MLVVQLTDRVLSLLPLCTSGPAPWAHLHCVFVVETNSHLEQECHQSE